MSLTGSLFLWMLVAVTVVAFVAVVLGWPAMAGRGIPRVGGRVGMLVCLNALVLLTAGALLNAQFLFFADWTDLRGAFGGVPTSTAVSRGATASRAARTAVRGEAAVAASRLPPLPAGRISPTGVVTYTVRGVHSGLTGTVEVQLPSGYQDPHHARLRYPVMEAFPGYPGGAGSWIHTMALGSTVTQLAAAGRMREALVVSPQVELPPGVDTECVNGIGGRPQVETWLARDVPDWVGAHLPRADRPQLVGGDRSVHRWLVRRDGGDAAPGAVLRGDRPGRVLPTRVRAALRPLSAEERLVPSLQPRRAGPSVAPPRRDLARDLARRLGVVLLHARRS